MQDDNLFAYSTVNETLMFAASLRLPSTMSIQDKQRHVDTVIGKLGLTPARDVIIGGPKIRSSGAPGPPNGHHHQSVTQNPAKSFVTILLIIDL